ncbi:MULTISPECIES: hypothetical protein [Rhizobium]|uniref:hypothetical protein n=1 Tax=Rhizobium TaxID=379 RepID=UPI000462755E|nr:MULTISPECIES: hypothetical protein [Rhizobium]MBB3521012.1 hypothetical protein [Rhizobium sp. BK456]MDR6664042.1 hypothetical protein [Rhizobium sp. 1399]UFS81571.1 hypothetical protein LPB79_25195 [Rhizobium sp. T136]
MAYMSSADTALLLATMLHRSERTRARISDQTLKTVSRRTTLKAAFRTSVVEWAAEFGLLMYPLEQRGGYGLLKATTLEGATPLRAGQLVSAEMRAFRTTGSIDQDALYTELGLQEEEAED